MSVDKGVKVQPEPSDRGIFWSESLVLSGVGQAEGGDGHLHGHGRGLGAPSGWPGSPDGPQGRRTALGSSGLAAALPTVSEVGSSVRSLIRCFQGA